MKEIFIETDIESGLGRGYEFLHAHPKASPIPSTDSASLTLVLNSLKDLKART
jgi:hypothetical protein